MQDSGCQVSGLVHPSVCEMQKLSFGAGHGPFRFLWWERWSNPRFILWWAAFCRSVLRSGNSILKGAFLVIPTKVSNLAFSVTEEEVRQICREIVNTNPPSFSRRGCKVCTFGAPSEVERGKRQLKTTLFGSLDSTTAIAEEFWTLEAAESCREFRNNLEDLCRILVGNCWSMDAVPQTPV